MKYLQPYVNLRELIFQGGASNGTNPMCDFENYEEAVRLYLPQVTKLDSRELIPGLKTRQHTPKSNIRKRTTENVNPNAKGLLS